MQGDGWTKDPYGGEIEDGRIYGRGASDMKSGVMAMVQALIQYKERQDRPNAVKLLITSDEENGMTGARHLTEQGHADDLDALLITEPTSGMIGYAQKGVVGIEVTCRGKSAHSSAPQLGRNAIDDVYRVIQEVKSERFSITTNHHPALGPVVASITNNTSVTLPLPLSATRRTFVNSSIKFVLFCNRPAVSASTKSIFFAVARATTSSTHRGTDGSTDDGAGSGSSS